MNGAHFFSPSTNGFYHPSAHGSRTMLVPDPDWIEPEPVEAESDDDAEPAASTAHPLIEVENPDCRMPADVVEITAEHHQALLDAQTQGKMIVAGEDGCPVTIDRPPPSPEALRAAAVDVARSLLNVSAWAAAVDAPDAIKAAWGPYRAALWSILGDPNVVEPTWPTEPTV